MKLGFFSLLFLLLLGLKLANVISIGYFTLFIILFIPLVLFFGLGFIAVLLIIITTFVQRL